MRDLRRTTISTCETPRPWRYDEEPIVLAAALAASLAAAPIASANDYPSRPITLLVPFPPGGSADVVIRPVAAKVADALKQPIVIDNRSGGGGNIAAQATKIRARRLHAVPHQHGGDVGQPDFRRS